MRWWERRSAGSTSAAVQDPRYGPIVPVLSAAGLTKTVGSGRARRVLLDGVSLIDFPQQARALRIQATSSGGVAIHTWMLDHVGGGALGTISRQLSYIDAHP